MAKLYALDPSMDVNSIDVKPLPFLCTNVWSSNFTSDFQPGEVSAVCIRMILAPRWNTALQQISEKIRKTE